MSKIYIIFLKNSKKFLDIILIIIKKKHLIKFNLDNIKKNLLIIK